MATTLPAAALPEQNALLMAFPNPFNPTTTIEILLTAPASIQLALFNLSGEQVVLLREGWLSSGRYQFHFSGVDLPSGIYFCRLRLPDQQYARRLLLLK